MSEDNVSLEEAFKETIKKVNNDIDDIIFLSDLILKFNDTDENLKKYVEIVHNAIDGHLFSYSLCKRYGGISISHEPFTA